MSLAMQLKDYRLTTAEILYCLPDHPALLQTYVWQDLDLAPEFPTCAIGCPAVTLSPSRTSSPDNTPASRAGTSASSKIRVNADCTEIGSSALTTATNNSTTATERVIRFMSFLTKGSTAPRFFRC